MKIYLARHGETSGDVKKIFGGAYDDSLTRKGREQSHRLGKLIQKEKVSLILVSPKKRTRQTVKILQTYLSGCSTHVIDGLRVCNHYGVMTGMKESEAKKKYPHLVRLLEESSKNTIEGGEGYEEFIQRVLQTYEEI